MTGAGRTATAGTNGFLFCDLRGYAAYVDARGDRAAAELLGAYRALVREVIAAHAGAEIRTEGDSVYVVFPTASAAVEAAVGIVEAAAAGSTRERPIRVGVGVHAGETIASDEGPVGEAVNIAARVCTKAQAGEVLVTDTVRSITRTLLPYRFVGLGRQSLKGIGGIALYRVEAVSAGRVAHLRRRLVARRRLVGGLAALMVVAIVGVTAAWAVTKPRDCLTLGPETHDVVVRIDPARRCVMEVFDVGLGPAGVAATASAIVVANTDSGTLSVLDPATQIQRVVGVLGRPLDMVVAPNGDVVVLSHDDAAERQPRNSSEDWTLKRLVRVSTTQGRVVTTYELPFIDSVLERNVGRTASSGFAAIAMDGARIFLANAKTGGLGRCTFDGSRLCPTGVTVLDGEFVEPNTGVGDQPVAAGTDTVVVAGGVAWGGDSTEPVLYRYAAAAAQDPRKPAGTRAAAIALGGGAGTRAIAATRTTLWLLRTDRSVTPYDLVRGVLPSLPASSGAATAIAASESALWLASEITGRVWQVDQETGADLTAVSVGGSARGLAIAPDGSVWVTVAGR